ncbi:MAG: NAD(P)-dependent glycerol-3-phosphate dehydrogenase [Gemmatimonadota bacterium]|nr:NAD(P)-dependent glycerol-3-phosphate dehydrogenase [Gemmatimonadota bacterium]
MLGAGAWGTALADRLARNEHEVRVWAYEPDVADSMNQSHCNRFLAGISLDPSISASTQMKNVVRDAELVVLVAPSHVTRAVAESAQPDLSSHATVVVASKGIEQHSLARMTQIAQDVFQRDAAVALSGPTFAAEVARGQPTAVVAACPETGLAKLVQHAFHSASFRVYTQHDVIGVELGGAVKNVMALATGIAEGLELGFNARAALVTRGLAEMTRLGIALGADPATFAGLAGVGDLVLTCTGQLSRNRALGVDIGRGMSLDEALAGRETVAEGVITTRSAKALSDRMGVTMPIVDAAFGVLFEGQAPQDAIGELMNRDPRAERDE